MSFKFIYQAYVIFHSTENFNLYGLDTTCEFRVLLPFADRVVPFSDINKNERLRLAVNALEKNPSLIPSSTDDIATVEAEVNLKLTLDDGMILLPNPRKITAGWTSTYSFFPDTARAEIQQYIADCKYSYFAF